MFYSVEFLNLSPGVSLLALKDCSEEVRREPGYIGVFATKTQNIKRLLLIKENQTSRVNEFPVYGKMEESGFTEIFPLMCTFTIWGQYLFLFFVFHLESLQSGRRQWLMAREPQHPVFTDMAGDILCAQVKLSHSYPYYVFPSSTSTWRVIRQSVKTPYSHLVTSLITS